jgi:hypothetical protein
MFGWDWETIFEWIGKTTFFVTPLGLATVWFGKTYIDKWLTRRFQGQLDNLKHIQAQEIERLRAKIAGMLDRVTKLHQHEFEILPEAWRLLATTMGSASHVLAALQNFPDAGAHNEAELEVLLANTNFFEHDKQAVRDAANRYDRTKIFGDLYQRYAVRDAINDRQHFHNYVILKGIFIEPELRDRMMELSILIMNCLMDHRDMITDRDSFKQRDFSANRDKWKAAEPLKDYIHKMVSDRLWSAAKMDA